MLCFCLFPKPVWQEAQWWLMLFMLFRSYFSISLTINSLISLRCLFAMDQSLGQMLRLKQWPRLIQSCPRHPYILTLKAAVILSVQRNKCEQAVSVVSELNLHGPSRGNDPSSFRIFYSHNYIRSNDRFQINFMNSILQYSMPTILIRLCSPTCKMVFRNNIGSYLWIYIQTATSLDGERQL